MPLIKASLLPHSPLLIPEIGRANYAFLNKTVIAYERIGADLKTDEVETIILISPHGAPDSDSFVVNVAPELEMSFKDFGFIPPRTMIKGDSLLADQIKNTLRPDFPLNLISDPMLDHGSAIPLCLLKKILEAGEALGTPGQKAIVNNLKIVVISPPAGADRQTLFDFGSKLQTLISADEKHIAVIASGDLSHRLKKKSPGGYSPKGAKFDNKLIEYLSAPESATENILKMDEKLIADAGECGLKSLMILLGVLNGLNWQPEVLAYQTDFGIGYLSLDFKI